MIQISKNRLIIPDTAQITKWQKKFDEQKCIVLPNFIEEKLLQKIIHDLDSSTFREKKHFGKANEVFASDLSIQNNNSALHIINFLLNNSSFFSLIEQITNSKPIRGFSGRIYRNMPNTEHCLDWHDDTQEENRLIAMSINLSKEKFEGGIFQIREKVSMKILKEVTCGNPGDTHIFQVSPCLEHRVTKTIGTSPRTAAAGWFLSIPAQAPMQKK
jgi:hypothetical protein